MHFTEPQLYNLYNRTISEKKQSLIDLSIKLHAMHLYFEHGFGKRKIAKRLGIKMKEVDELLNTSWWPKP